MEFGIICFYLKAVDRKIRFQFRSLFRLDREILKKFLRVGSPVIGGDAMWGIAQGAQTAIIGRLGASAIAANSISTTVIQVLTVIIHGSANATGVMTGKWIGAGKIEELKRYAKRLQLVFLALGLVTGVTLYLVKDFILGFYAITPETKTMAVHFIIILCITTVGTGYQLNVLTGFVRGGGDTTFRCVSETVPGHRGHSMDYEPPQAGFTAAFQQGIHAADFVHGNRIKFSDAVRGLFRNFIRINMGVKINNIHHGTVLLSVQRYENFHRFQFLTIKTQFIILSEDVFFCQGKDYCKGKSIWLPALI